VCSFEQHSRTDTVYLLRVPLTKPSNAVLLARLKKQLAKPRLSKSVRDHANRKRVKMKYDPEVRTSTQSIAEKVLITMSHNYVEEGFQITDTQKLRNKKNNLDTLDPRNTNDRIAVMGLDHITPKAK
jgi:hypothetical protein